MVKHGMQLHDQVLGDLDGEVPRVRVVRKTWHSGNGGHLAGCYSAVADIFFFCPSPAAPRPHVLITVAVVCSRPLDFHSTNVTL